MAGHEPELTAALRARGELRDDETVLAAWSGRLLDLRGDDKAAELPTVAILGISRQRGHILSRAGSYSFSLSHVRSPFSPYLGCLRFDVHQEAGSALHVIMAIDGAVAIADQLREVSRTPPQELATAATRRPLAKRRAEISN